MERGLYECIARRAIKGAVSVGLHIRNEEGFNVPGRQIWNGQTLPSFCLGSVHSVQWAPKSKVIEKNKQMTLKGFKYKFKHLLCMQCAGLSHGTT